MPLLIEYIDEIACRLNRDVLMIGPDRTTAAKHDSSWKRSLERKSLLTWLDEQHINWELCGWLSTPGVTHSYQGDIYLDFLYSPDDARYQKFRNFVQEQENGSVKWPGVRVYLLTIGFCQNRQITL